MDRDFSSRPKFTTAALLSTAFAAALISTTGCGLEFPQSKPVKTEPFDLVGTELDDVPERPTGAQISDFAVEYTVDLGIPDDQPGNASEVRVVLPAQMPSKQVPALIVNGAGAYLFSGMSLTDEDIEPLLPYVQQGFAIIAYETDGCQPDFSHEPTRSEIAQMTRDYVASKAGLINAKRALSFALDRFPEIDVNHLYAIGHSSGGKQALLLAAHDKRIRGCVAFAPACEMDFGSSMTVARIGGSDGGTLSTEVSRSMPIMHAKATTVPLLLIYSSSDQITRPMEVLRYAKAVGDTAQTLPVQCDGHGAVPEAGFNHAVRWLRSQVGKFPPAVEATKLVTQAEPPATSATPSKPAPKPASPGSAFGNGEIQVNPFAKD